MFQKMLGNKARQLNESAKNDKSLRGKPKAKSCKCVPQSCKCKLRNAVKLLAKQRYHFRSNEILV